MERIPSTQICLMVLLALITGCFMGRDKDTEFIELAKEHAELAEYLSNTADSTEDWEHAFGGWEYAISTLNKSSEISQVTLSAYKSQRDGARQNFLDYSLKDLAVKSSSPVNAIQNLIDQGADPRRVWKSVLPGREHYAVLYSASRSGNDGTVKALLNAGASWDQLSKKQLDTALLDAACVGFLFNVEQLVEAGADPKTKNGEGYTALDLAQDDWCRSQDMSGPIRPGSRQHYQIVDLLRAIDQE